MPTSSRAGVVYFRGPVKWGNGPITPYHSTNRGCSVGFRDDVGIVPYKRDGPHTVQRTAVVSWGLLFSALRR